MANYSFVTDDGESIERKYPIGECPKEIILDDGRVAKRVFSCNFSMFSAGGHTSGDAAAKLNADMKRRQAEAGRRMRDNWQSVKSK